MNTLPASAEQAQARYQPVAQGFTAELDALQKRPMSQQTRALAVALDTKAQRFGQELEAARTELKKPILEAGRKLDAFFKRMAEPAAQTRVGCGRIIYAIDAAERKAAAEKAQREAAEALAKAEAERKAHADQLIEQAAATGDETLLEAAAEVKATPLEPTIVKPEEYKPAASGYSTRELPTGTVTNLYALVRWLVESEDRFGVMFSDLFGEPKQARLDAFLRKGITFPAAAVSVGKTTASRNATREQ